MNDSPTFQSVSFIGLGLIGGSLARLIRWQLPQTRLYALDNPDVLAQAHSEGILSGSLTDLTDDTLLQSDLIILATHPHLTYNHLQALAHNASSPLNVMDIGSSKTTICQLATTLPETIRFIGGHPLAGREVSGFKNSRQDLFYGKQFLLTPCETTPTTLTDAVTTWCSSLGMLPTVMDPLSHDKLMALVSHFPQLYAFALANLLSRFNPQDVLHYLGGGIDDQMRLMASSADMWSDVFADNQTHVDQVLGEFIDILQEMRQGLRNKELDKWMQQSHTIYGIYQDYKQEATKSPVSE